MEFFTYKQTHGKNSINGKDGNLQSRNYKGLRQNQEIRKNRHACKFPLATSETTKLSFLASTCQNCKRRHFCSFQPPILEYFVTVTLKKKQTIKQTYLGLNCVIETAPFIRKEGSTGINTLVAGSLITRLNLRNNCQSLLRNNC